jgi:predicted nucleic acid-binding Zn ribbon protein
MKRMIPLMLANKLIFVPATPLKHNNMEKKNFYCEHCGQKFSSVRILTSSPCPSHPDGACEGTHKLYEGTEKSEYTRKYCGHQFNTILQMCAAPCLRHQKRGNKGNHALAL